MTSQASLGSYRRVPWSTMEPTSTPSTALTMFGVWARAGGPGRSSRRRAPRAGVATSQHSATRLY
eukprot:6192872-Pleurochrysis_carterae.AAC.3